MADDVRQVLDDIECLITSGQIDAAEAMCDEALRERPDEVNLVALAGAIQMEQGVLDSAEAHLLRAVEIEPGFAKPHEDLGALFLIQDKAEQAIPHFRKAMVLAPDQPSVVFGLASALSRAGREEDADELRLGFLQGLSTEQLLAEAKVLCGKGYFQEAEQVCDVILVREPENTGALRALAMVATAEERHIIAEGYLKRIVRLAPNDPEALGDLGRFMHDRGRYPEAIQQLQSAVSLSPQNASNQLLLGNTLAIVGRHDNALHAYEQCLLHDSDEPSALVGRGHMLRIAGRKDEAQASYERCLAASPELGAAWWYLASLRHEPASDADVAIMLGQLEGGQLPAESAVGFHFALAREYEKQGDFEAAWEQYSLGNSGKRDLVKYDPVKSELEQSKIRSTFTAELISARAEVTPAEVTPIFILGMPRSGSTLIEQIIASHSQAEGSGELPYILMMTASMVAKEAGSLHYTELVNLLDEAELTRLGNNYLGHAESHRIEGVPYFTDKMPANFPHAGFIRMILPHAKIIDARRDPMATCVANYRQLFAQGKNQSYDLTELGEYYARYEMMMDHWDEVMPGQILRVQYEDVVTDLDTQVRRILDYCGLPFESACLEYHKSARPVNTASAEQVREPIYDSAVEFWKNYEPYLDELRDVLTPPP